MKDYRPLPASTSICRERYKVGSGRLACMSCRARSSKYTREATGSNLDFGRAAASAPSRRARASIDPAEAEAGGRAGWGAGTALVDRGAGAAEGRRRINVARAAGLLSRPPAAYTQRRASSRPRPPERRYPGARTRALETRELEACQSETALVELAARAPPYLLLICYDLTTRAPRDYRGGDGAPENRRRTLCPGQVRRVAGTRRGGLVRVTQRASKSERGFPDSRRSCHARPRVLLAWPPPSHPLAPHAPRTEHRGRACARHIDSAEPDAYVAWRRYGRIVSRARRRTLEARGSGTRAQMRACRTRCPSVLAAYLVPNAPCK